MFLFEANEKQSTLKKQKRKKLTAEAKAIAKAKKVKQDDMDALQITFYEIESWIEKTTPVLDRMTKELDRVSHHFTNTKKPDIIHDLSLMKWSLSFQPNNSIRLETNIKSIDQLADAVQKIKLITQKQQQKNDSSTTTTSQYEDEEDDDASFSNASSINEASIEYWNNAMYRRPNTCLEKYKHCDMNLGRLTEDVSPNTLTYICQVYWDCLHPKFSSDWSSFWDRSSDPKRNQVCVDSGLAMVFLHIVRHDRNACANAQSIAYYYYDRARDSLMDYFDSPDLATIETLLNLALFCVLCKRHSQSRIYLSLAYRMIHQLRFGKKSQLPQDPIQRKRLYKIHMVLYYNDIIVSVYSGESPIIDESTYDIDFYEVITLNKTLTNQDQKIISRETFFVYLLELTRIGKKIQSATQDYQRQNLQYHHNGTLPSRWVRKIQELEISLANWFDKLPVLYRVDPTSSDNVSSRKETASCIMDITMLHELSGLLLMIQYQTHWIMLHKIFLSPKSSLSSNLVITDHQFSATPYRTLRSHHICTDAANRIVVMAEIITDRFDWCVFQRFINCVYQASTIFCKNIINKGDDYKASKFMIHRITSVLAASKVNYNGFPDDLTACLNEFLAENYHSQDDKLEILDQIFTEDVSQHTIVYNDNMFNSPQMFEACLKQPIVTKKPLTMNKDSLTSEAMFSIKLQNPTTVVPLDLEPSNKNWRYKFSSSNIAQINHRVM